MSIYYIDRDTPSAGYYEVFQRPDTTWQWTWTEVAKGIEYKDDGPIFETRAQALRGAADDWEFNGSGRPRFSAMLRALATRSEAEA